MSPEWCVLSEQCTHGATPSRGHDIEHSPDECAGRESTIRRLRAGEDEGGSGLEQEATQSGVGPQETLKTLRGDREGRRPEAAAVARLQQAPDRLRFVAGRSRVGRHDQDLDLRCGVD